MVVKWPSLEFVIFFMGQSLVELGYLILYLKPRWPSPPGTFHIFIGKFSYFVIRFLLNSSIVKSGNEIGEVNDKKNLT